jgi:hypothetical protein
MMRNLDALTFEEKLALTAFLVDRLRHDSKSERIDVMNGAEQAPDARSSNRSNDPDPQRRLEYAWLKEHRAEYAGQYVALFNDRLIAHGTDGRSTLDEARQAGFPRALIVRVESLDEPPFGGW